MELKKVQKRVYEILHDQENARNSDKSLLAVYIWRYCKKLLTGLGTDDPKLPLKNFDKLPSIKSIMRARRMVQNEKGEFLPTSKQVRKQRRIKEEEYRTKEVPEAKEANANEIKDD